MSLAGALLAAGLATTLRDRGILDTEGHVPTGSSPVRGRQDPADDQRTEVRPRSIAEFRSLLREVTGASVQALLLPTREPDPEALVRVAGATLAELCVALAACEKAPFEAGWAWPNHLCLELPRRRYLSCSWLPGDDTLLDVAGLGDLRTTPALDAVLRGIVADAEWQARRRAGIVSSVDEARRIGPGGFASDARALRLQDATDAMLEAIAEGFSSVRTLSIISGGVNITDRGAAALARMASLQVLHLRGCAIGDDGVAALAALPGLRELRLGRARGSPGMANALTGTGFDAFAEHGALQVLDLSWAEALTDDGLRAIAAVPALTSLDLQARRPGRVTEPGLRALARLTSLRRLVLAYWPLDVDSALGPVAAGTHLETLDLSETPIGGRGLAALAEADHLHTLDLRRCARIDDAALEAITGLTRLRELRLRMNRGVTDAGVGAIAELENLRILELSNMTVGGAGIGKLQHLRLLEELDASFTRIDDRGVAALARLENLRVLNLAGCQAITPASARVLSRMRKLRVLDVNLCRGLDADAVKSLREALPGTRLRVSSEFR